MLNICIFGDSIARGEYDSVNGGWANLLINDLRERKDDASVYNLSICGDTTAGLLKRFKVEAVARNPEIIIFAIGINDASYDNVLHKETVVLPQFKKNFSKLISEARKFTPKIIFVGLTRVTEEVTDPVNWADISYLNSKIELYDDVIKEICRKEKLSYIKVSRLITKEDLEDGLHPNTRGHEKLFEKVKVLLNK